MPEDSFDDVRASVLARVVAMRACRTQIRRSLQAGEVTLAEVLLDTDDDLIAALKVKSVLTAVPALGKIKTVRLLARLGISEFERIGALDLDQRRRLVAEACSVDG
ncbi:MAG TPA: integration host factor, actinobacterial type [Acidimicrobiia bacterium]|nr:integration host factor, actinobacterial type [Acidimicrobiia bacterium]